MTNNFGLSENAITIFKTLYSFEGESIAQTFRRVAKEFSAGDKTQEDEAFRLLSEGIWRPGTPVFFNAGTDHKVFSACFVIDLKDSMDSIYDTANVARKIFQHGAGVGIPIGNLREGEAPIFEGRPGVSPTGKSSGSVSFMKLYDTVGATTKSGGRTRRAAILCAMPVDHPDIMNFIQCKEIDGILSNMNISVAITDKFMDSLEDKVPFTLHTPYDGSDRGTVDPQVVWDEIVKMSHKTADPGVFFIDTVNKYNPLKKVCRISASNPCIVGSSIIATADGRNGVTISQLAAEGVDVPVYSRNISTGQIQIKMGRNPRKTANKVEVYKLTLDDGSSFIATPDHLIMKKDRTYTPLKDLEVGESISPFNTFKSNNQYRQVCEVGARMTGGVHRNRRQYRLIHEFYNGVVDAKKYAIHHQDFHTWDDTHDNLQVMLHEDHRRLHADKMMGEKNPYHRMTDEWKHNFASHPVEKNGKYSGVTNEELLAHGRKLYEEEGMFTQLDWRRYTKENNIPWFVANDFRFKSFSNFKSIVIGNHKVASVEPYGYEDVYNITVDDNHNYVVLTSYVDDKFIESSGICVKNCGEQFLNPYLACVLSAINIRKFIVDGMFDFNLLASTTKNIARLMDNLIEIMDFPDPRFKDMVRRWRPMGIGPMGLADTLFELNIAYDSNEGRQFAEKVMMTMTASAIDASVDMTIEHGKLEQWDYIKDDILPIIKEHCGEYEETYKRAVKHGTRNIQWTTCQPTGTTAISADASYGIEPCFGLVFTKNLIDGTTMHMVNPVFQKYDGNPWYTDDLLTKIAKNGGSLKGLRGIPKEIRETFVVAHDIKPKDRVEMQASLQKYVSNAISSTVNLPKDATLEEVSELYKLAYKLGLKGVTIYRDGSKKSQPINFTTLEKKELEIPTPIKPLKRPKRMPSTSYQMETGNGDMLIDVATLEGRVMQIVLNIGKSGQSVNTLLEALGRTMSIGLQHGVPLQAFIKTMEGINSDKATWFRFEDTDKKPAQILSIPDGLAKLLKRYYIDVGKTVSDEEPMVENERELCPECGTYSVVMIEGCRICQNCQYSCCS